MPLSASTVTCIHQLPARLSNPEENTFSNSSPHHIFQGRDAVDDSSEKKRKGQRLWMICQSILSSSAPPSHSRLRYFATSFGKVHSNCSYSDLSVRSQKKKKTSCAVIFFGNRFFIRKKKEDSDLLVTGRKGKRRKR